MNQTSSALPAQVLEGIARGAPLDADRLLGVLCAPAVGERAHANASLAEALYAAGRTAEAEHFAERAFQQSAYAHEFLPLYVKIEKSLGRIEQVREAYRRAGIRLAESGSVAEAIALFNLSHYAYEQAGLGDRYDSDFEIMQVVDALAQHYQRAPAAATERRREGPLRVAYLVFGAAHSGSALVKLLCKFAEHHDRTRYDVRFYVPESPRTPRHMAYAEYLRTNIALLEKHGGRVEAANAQSELDGWLQTDRAMREFGADLLVTTALLADYSNYFIAALRPAPAIVGLGLGPPAQYAAPGLDWVVCASRHPMMDMPCGASFVELEYALPESGSITPQSRAAHGIPADAPLLVVAGRAQKFLDREFWRMLGQILVENPQAWLLVLGLAEPPAFLDTEFTTEARARFRQLGWRVDYLMPLAMADVAIDTYPSGGGYVLTDAMALGIPVACFRNDYLHAFDQTNWSPAEEFVGVPELIAARGDFAALRGIVGALIAEPAHRRELGLRCRDWLRANRGQPERMVKRYEEIYQTVAARTAGRAREAGLSLASDAARGSLGGRGEWGKAPEPAPASALRRMLRRATRLLAG